MHDWHKIYWNQLVLIGVAAGFETFRSSSLRSLPHSFVFFCCCCCWCFIYTYVYGRKYEIVYKMDSRKCLSYFITYLLYRLMVVISVFEWIDWDFWFFFFFSRTGNSILWNIHPVTHRLRSTPFSNYQIKLVIWKSRKYFYLEFLSRAWSYAAWYLIQLMYALIMLL